MYPGRGTGSHGGLLARNVLPRGAATPCLGVRGGRPIVCALHAGFYWLRIGLPYRQPSQRGPHRRRHSQLPQANGNLRATAKLENKNCRFDENPATPNCLKLNIYTFLATQSKNWKLVSALLTNWHSYCVVVDNCLMAPVATHANRLDACCAHHWTPAN